MMKSKLNQLQKLRVNGIGLFAALYTYDPDTKSFSDMTYDDLYADANERLSKTKSELYVQSVTLQDGYTAKDLEDSYFVPKGTIVIKP